MLMQWLNFRPPTDGRSVSLRMWSLNTAFARFLSTFKLFALLIWFHVEFWVQKEARRITTIAMIYLFGNLIAFSTCGRKERKKERRIIIKLTVSATIKSTRVTFYFFTLFCCELLIRRMNDKEVVDLLGKNERNLWICNRNLIPRCIVFRVYTYNYVTQ